MLETIREYGAERIDEADERSEVARRHRAHYQALLEHASAEEEGAKQAEWRARVMAEMDNIRAALNSALEDGDGAALIALTCGAGNTWTLMGRSTEHHRWLEEALALAPDDSPYLPDAVYQLGIADQFVGDLESSHRHLGEAVAALPRVGQRGWCPVAAGGVRVHRCVPRRAGRRDAAVGGRDRPSASDRGRRRRPPVLHGAQHRPVPGHGRASGASAPAARDRARDPGARRALPALGVAHVGAEQRDAGRSRSCRVLAWTSRLPTPGARGTG